VDAVKGASDAVPLAPPGADELGDDRGDLSPAGQRGVVLDRMKLIVAMELRASSPPIPDRWAEERQYSPTTRP